ncbi:MAG: hypothetical protein N4A45_06365 [Flavobacteriales bacterium]|nr:hypothetical protein [Flavobacteriales bacterium]
MKYLFSLLFFMVLSVSVQAQTKCHIIVESAKVYAEPSDMGTEVLSTQKKYANVYAIGSTNDNWIKIKVGNKEGYVKKNFIAKGHIKFELQTSRVGAYCRDGHKVMTIERNNCVDHGGVREWIKDRVKTPVVYH